LPASPSQRRHLGNQRSGWSSLVGSGGAGVPQEGEAAGQGVAAPTLDLLSYSEKTELIFLQEKTFYDFSFFTCRSCEYLGLIFCSDLFTCLLIAWKTYSNTFFLLDFDAEQICPFLVPKVVIIFAF
jgi:hypothetical protein